MSRYIIDISSIFRVSVLLDTISANDSQSREKSVNIGDISSIYWLWPDISESKLIKVAIVQKKTKKNHFGQYIGPITDVLRNLFLKKQYLRWVSRYKANI